jgi:general secretion pathway protein E
MLRDWIKMVGNVKEATKALRAATNQRLLRTLCPNCKQAYQPSEDQLKKLNLPAGRVEQLYRAGGQIQIKNKVQECPVCQGIGYLGQTGVFEVLLVDEEMRKLLAKGDLKGTLALARRNKMIYLQEAALAKVVSGETDMKEVIRVTAPARGEAGADQSQQDKPAA